MWCHCVCAAASDGTQLPLHEQPSQESSTAVQSLTAFPCTGVEGPIEVYNFPGSILETAGVDRPVPPFAIVGSKDFLAGETFWPVRRYKWGTCEAANYEHSDFQLLK